MKKNYSVSEMFQTQLRFENYVLGSFYMYETKWYIKTRSYLEDASIPEPYLLEWQPSICRYLSVIL